MRRGRGDRGQATVEVALVLPFLVALLFVLAQIGLIVRTQVMVVHAARQTARVVAVDTGADAHSAALGSAGLDPGRTTVSVDGSLEPGGLVTVTVTSTVIPALPLFGGSLDPIELTGEATMLVEGMPDESGS